MLKMKPEERASAVYDELMKEGEGPRREEFVRRLSLHFRECHDEVLQTFSYLLYAGTREGPLLDFARQVVSFADRYTPPTEESYIPLTRPAPESPDA